MDTQLNLDSDITSDPDTSVIASPSARARMERAGRAAAEKRGRATGARTAPDLRPRRGAGRWMPLFAFVVVGGLAAVVALPAYAERDTASVVTSVRVDEGQSIEAGGGEILTSRDGLSAAIARSANQIHFPVHYTNNPNAAIQWPFPYFVPISDMFGTREAPCAGCSTDHYGTDFDANEGDPIQAIADGVVVKVMNEDHGGDGLYVNIAHNVNGMEFLSRYCHLEPGSITVVEGQAVTVTQIIGNVGVSGTSTGSHLHFELHVGGTPVDPFAWLTEHAV